MVVWIAPVLLLKPSLVVCLLVLLSALGASMVSGLLVLTPLALETELKPDTWKGILLVLVLV
jgi:hypothetical protein